MRKISKINCVAVSPVQEKRNSSGDWVCCSLVDMFGLLYDCVKIFRRPPCIGYGVARNRSTDKSFIAINQGNDCLITSAFLIRIKFLHLDWSWKWLFFEKRGINLFENMVRRVFGARVHSSTLFSVRVQQLNCCNWNGRRNPLERLSQDRE